MNKSAEILQNLIRIYEKSDLKASSGKIYGKYNFYISGESSKKINNYLIDGIPSILMSTGGSAHIHFDDERFSYSTDTLAFTSSNTLETMYLYYLLSANKNKISNIYFQGSGLEHLNRRYFFNSKVLIHNNLEDQKRIAQKLLKIDNLILSIENLHKKSQFVYLALLNQLMPSEGELVKNLQTSDDIFSMDSIKSLTSVVGSGSTPKGGDKNYKKKGVPFIRSGDVKNGFLDKSEIKFIDLNTHKQMMNSEVILDDVLLNITGASIGRSAVNTIYKSANVNQHVMRIRAGNKIYPSYLSYYLSSKYGQDQIMSYEAGGSKEGLDKKNTEDIKIIYPENKATQKQIIEKLEYSLQNINNLNSLLKKTKNIKFSLLDETFKDTLIE